MVIKYLLFEKFTILKLNEYLKKLEERTRVVKIGNEDLIKNSNYNLRENLE